MSGVLDFDLKDFSSMEQTIRALGGVPKKCVGPAARKGATQLKRVVKSSGLVPVRTGALRKGIKLRPEKSPRGKCKKVYEVTFLSEMNDVFVKLTKGGVRYYYPASQEYGFKTRNGGRVGVWYFLKKAADGNESVIQQIMLAKLSEELVKAWEKKQEAKT